MAMEPGGEKVACGMAKASLYESKSLQRQIFPAGGSRVRCSFAVTADRRESSAVLLCRSDHANGSARIEPRTAFSPAILCRRGCDNLSGNLSGTSGMPIQHGKPPLSHPCHLTVMRRRYLTPCFGIERARRAIKNGKE
jgi:hypothetical protein